MKEKWIRINTIEGYENVREYYYLSNSDEDMVVNRNTGKVMKIGLNTHGYKRVILMTRSGKIRNCLIHTIKAKAFLFGPNPLGYNVVRHLNDVKTDNRLENLAWGTRSDNTFDSIRNGRYNYEAAIRGCTKSGKISGTKNGAKNGKKLSKPVRCLETGIIYLSCIEAERQTGIDHSSISKCCRGRFKTAGKYHWEYVNHIQYQSHNKNYY